MIRANRLVILVALAVLAALTGGAVADVPNVMSYQGRLTDSLGDPLPDGDYLMTFTVVNQPSGMSLVYWSSGQQSVAVNDGLFTYELGSNSPLPDGLFAGTGRWLAISIDGIGEMLPRTSFTSTAFAFESLHADTADYAADVAKMPDISYNTSTAGVTLVGDSMRDCVNDYIDCPGPGYVIVTGKCYVRLSGTQGYNGAYFQIDASMGGAYSTPYYSMVSVDSTISDGDYRFPVVVTRIFYVSEASRQYYRLEGQKVISDGIAMAYQHIVHALYFPISYGKVK